MIDLHCHSTCSDGTLTPEELAEKGRDFAVFAITDHDNCDGGERFLKASAEFGLGTVPEFGFEFAVGWGQSPSLGCIGRAMCPSGRWASISIRRPAA